MSIPCGLVPPSFRHEAAATGAGAMRVIVPGEATGNAYAVCLGSFEPGSGPGRHVHAREDEILHVLEGRLLLWCDGRVFEAGSGDTAALPRGVPHSFRVISDRPARVLTTVIPGGLEHFLAAAAGLRSPDEQARLAGVGRDYGIEYVNPLPEA